MHNEKMKRYLGTGGAGFIGSHLCKRLLDAGHHVTCVDNFYNGNLNNIRGLFNSKNFYFVEENILNFNRIKELAKDCDHIYHLAAQIHVEKSIIRPDETMEINLQGTRNLLEICTQNKNISMTLASSAEVYGESPGAHSETSALNPQSPYAASKVAAESLCISYYYTYGSNVRVIRNFNTFGPRQKSSGYGSVISIFCRRALDGKPLIIYGDGEQTRDYQYIDDAIEGYLLSESLPAGEIINTGFGVDHKIIDIGKEIIDICGSKSNIVFADPRPGEVHKLRSNVDKLKSYGFVPKNSLREGLQKYIDWLQKYDLDSLGVMK
jgi:UDP-glucose 4-epimerase